MIIYRCDRCGKEQHEDFYALRWHSYILNTSLIDAARTTETINESLCKNCAKDFRKFMANKTVLPAKNNT